MLKSYSVIRSFGLVLAFSSCGWKSPHLVCALILFSSCSGGDSSSSGIAVTTAPSAPSSLSLVTPQGSPGSNPTPTISVSGGGVLRGNTVRLFSDPACATLEIGSAVSSGTSVSITVNSALAFSLHTIYANATNVIGTSPCSSSSVSYKILDCPSGFIPVGHNMDVGTTSDFCVMKYEAKALNTDTSVIDTDGCNEPGCTTANWGLANHIPESSPTGSPWRRINPINASAECNSLNTGGATNYDLISNPEWMTIARNAESVSSNFEASVMARGWAAKSSNPFRPDPWTNLAVASSTDASCLYNTGADTCASSGDHLYKRTLVLSNSEEIWDFSGNVWEWVDWNASIPSFQEGPKTCAASWVEFPVAAFYECLSGLADQVFPANSNGSSVEAFGLFYGGPNGAAMRGGDWDDGSYVGAFALYLGSSTTHASANRGFRCVYRP